MLIPVRCFTCGKVLADKWDYYVKEVERLKKGSKDETILNVNVKTVQGTPEGKVLNSLGLTRYCCRRAMLSNVELIDLI